MDITVVVMIILGLALIIASFIVSEKYAKQEEGIKADFTVVDENYEFSEQELSVIKEKITDVIADRATQILYETNESLSAMSNDKTLALGDYAVTVYEEIEKNHKEAVFLYSMLNDKQKEIMAMIKQVDEAKQEVNQLLIECEEKEKALADERALLTAENKVTVSYVPQEEIQETKEEENQKEYTPDFEALDNFDQEAEQEFEDSENVNELILELYKTGMGIVDVAKHLGLGVGEVKLVVDLYKGE